MSILSPRNILSRQSRQACRELLSRRSFVAGSACAAAGLSLGRATPARADATASPKRLLTVFCNGGWDISYALDPKPGLSTVDSPEGDVQLFDDLPILVHESRPQIGAFFEAYGGMTAVVNGIDVSSIAHDACRARMMTGNNSGTTPDAAVIIASQLGTHVDAPYLQLSEHGFVGDMGVHAVSVGRVNQIQVLLDRDTLPPTPGAPFSHAGFVASDADEALIREFVEGRASRLQMGRAAMGFNHDRVDDFIASLGKGDRLKLRADEFGPLGQEQDLLQQAALALSALSDGMCWTASISVSGFDTHDDNAPQGPLQDSVFGGLLELADAMAALPGTDAGNSLLDETVVLVFSEMSRTPRLNSTGGKDHHPVTSAMLFGGGVAGGRAYGGTSDTVQSELVDFATGDVDPDGGSLTVGAFVSGVVQTAGGDPSEFIPNATPFAPMCV